jgi:hypothetical protein
MLAAVDSCCVTAVSILSEGLIRNPLVVLVVVMVVLAGGAECHRQLHISLTCMQEGQKYGKVRSQHHGCVMLYIYDIYEQQRWMKMSDLLLSRHMQCMNVMFAMYVCNSMPCLSYNTVCNNSQGKVNSHHHSCGMLYI